MTGLGGWVSVRAVGSNKARLIELFDVSTGREFWACLEGKRKL
jgi:hypothetical protein